MSGSGSWIIGSSPECDLVINSPVVSRRHCRLTRTRRGFLLEDLSSSNGTYVNQELLAAPRHVSEADAISLGRTTPLTWNVILKLAAATGQPATPSQHAEASVAFELRDKPLILGRHPSCDQVLDFPMISSRHARLVRSGASLVVEDLGSTNGTFVNGRRISSPVRVQRDDVIALGSYTVRLAADGSLKRRDCRDSITLEARDVSVDLPVGRLLDRVSLTIYPAEFVGLMGPSGAGKTTLLAALNGYTRPSTGSVLFNGRDLYEHFGEFQGLIGYVPQDDIMHRDLTVRQALYFSARLRLPVDFSDAEIEARIAAVLSQLGLEETEHVVIGSPEKKGISGGQRKRVNLAMELLTDPAMLFLDEPTSGLSSVDALVVMQFLRRLADAGKTILLTIHQPSVEAYRQLDNLIVIAKVPIDEQQSPAGQTRALVPGRLVYYGPAYPEACEFFAPPNENVALVAPPSPDDVLRGLSLLAAVAESDLGKGGPEAVFLGMFNPPRRQSHDPPRAS